MGGLPHSWKDQVDARNKGQYDQWLIAKKTGYKGFEGQPMTMGYYTREDIPFNYALADAFTVCDQHFCSSLTGTTPNRLYFWTGALRKDGAAQNPALVRNEESDYGAESEWKTIPELLQDNGISWKVYQNEISLPSGLDGDADAWLSNFTDNPLEWFTQFKVRRSTKYESYLVQHLALLDKKLTGLEQQATQHPEDPKKQKALDEMRRQKNTKQPSWNAAVKNWLLRSATMTRYYITMLLPSMILTPIIATPKHSNTTTMASNGRCRYPNRMCWPISAKM